MARLLVQAGVRTDARVHEQVAAFLMHRRRSRKNDGCGSGIRTGQRHSPTGIRLPQVINAPDCGHTIAHR